MAFFASMAQKARFLSSVVRSAGKNCPLIVGRTRALVANSTAEVLYSL